jgi:hypothetical protein
VGEGEGGRRITTMQHLTTELIKELTNLPVVDRAPSEGGAGAASGKSLVRVCVVLTADGRGHGDGGRGIRRPGLCVGDMAVLTAGGLAVMLMLTVGGDPGGWHPDGAADAPERGDAVGLQRVWHRRGARPHL